MISKKNLVLIGMMGAGKSTIGSILAKKIDYEFIDIDDKIEKFQRMEIAKIFKIKGEENFRNIEEKISIKYLRDNGKVIALGGGAFLNKNIQSLIAKNHVSFWLNWKNITIIRRIRRNRKRPLANKLGDEDIKKLIINRNEFYAKADYKIECENKTKLEIVEKIIKNYEKL